ncbi:MAG: MFS transporter [Proteobacteria bacterium]|nr:MFS transporter [Pseudomonadota bacterium]
MAAGIVVAFHVGKMPPALPSVRADLGATLRQGGWLLSVVSLMTAVGGMAIALTADRLGHRRLVLLGAAICFSAALVGAFSTDVSQLIVGRFFEGVGFIATTAAAPSLLVRLARGADIRRVMALWTIYMPAGAGTMMLVAAVILPYASWRIVWLVSASASGAMLIALLWRTLGRRELDPPPAATRRLGADVVAVVTSAGPLAIALCFAAYSSCWYAIVGFLPTLQIERLGMSAFTAAVVTAAVTFVNVAGNLAAGVLLGRGVPRSRLIVGATVPMAVCAAGIFIDGVPDAVRLLLAGLYSMVIGVVPSALFTAIPLHAPRPHLVGVTTGLLMQGSNTGALLGPPITAMLVGWGGWPAAAWGTTAALSAVVVISIFLQRLERRKLSP